MKKSLKTLVVSLLSANLIVGSMATVVLAEEGEGQTSMPESTVDQVSNDNSGGGEGNGDGNTSVPEESTPNESTPGESTPGESTPGESNPDETSESSDESGESDESEGSEESDESDESDESTDEGTVTPPTYPVGPPSSYVPPRTVPRTPVSTNTEVSETPIATQFGINSNVENLESLLAASLEDPNFVLAWEDYQTLINDFELKDITSESAAMGSTFNEILTNFEGNAIPEQTNTEDGQNVLVFNYSEETEEEEGTVPAQIILIGDEAGNLIGSALLQASTAQTTNEAVSAETIQDLVDQENAGLYAQDLFVTALYQVSSNDVTYTTIATPSETEGVYEFITLDNEYVLSHTTGEAEETSLLNQLQDSIATYIEGIENQSEAEVTEEPSEEGNESADEETTDEAETEETAEDEPVNQFVARFAPEDYDPNTLIEADTIVTGYEKLISMVEEGKLSYDPNQLTELLGEPSQLLEAGIFNFYYYYAVEEERVTLLELEVDTEAGQISTIRFENRTPKLDEAFPITIDELFDIANEDLSIGNLENHLEKANLVEHVFTGSYQTRYVWTSFEDPEMRSIEAFEEGSTNEVELYYYDQD